MQLKELSFALSILAMGFLPVQAYAEGNRPLQSGVVPISEEVLAASPLEIIEGEFVSAPATKDPAMLDAQIQQAPDEAAATSIDGTVMMPAFKKVREEVQDQAVNDAPDQEDVEVISEIKVEIQPETKPDMYVEFHVESETEPETLSGETLHDDATDITTHIITEDMQHDSLIEVLIWSNQNNPTLRAGRAELRSSYEELAQAFSGFLPTAQATGAVQSVDSAGSNFGSAKGTTSKEMDVSFNQPLYRGGETVSAMKRVRADIAAKRDSFQSLKQSVLLDVATAYMDLLRDQSLLDLADNNKEVIAQQLDAAQARFDVGELTMTDVAQARSRLASAEADRVKAVGVLRATRSRFERLSGRDAEELVLPRNHFVFPPTLDEAITIALDANPDITALQNSHLAAEVSVDEHFAQLLPDIDLTGGWNKTYDPQPGLIEEQTNKTIGVTATIPLFQGGSVRSEVRQAKHTANQRYIEIMEMARIVKDEVISNWEALEASRTEIIARQVQVDAARIAREGVGAENQLGVRTVLDVLDADQELLDARNSLVSANRDKIVAQFSLAKSLGYLLSPEFSGGQKFVEDTVTEEGLKWKILGMDVDIESIDP